MAGLGGSGRHEEANSDRGGGRRSTGGGRCCRSARAPRARKIEVARAEGHDGCAGEGGRRRVSAAWRRRPSWCVKNDQGESPQVYIAGAFSGAGDITNRP